MNDHVVFATSAEDAEQEMARHGLNPEETTWVLNAQLLGSADYTGHHIHYSPLFMQMPAYQEAVAMFGPGKDVN